MAWESSFRGELHFLSNFYPSPFILNGVYYPTVEHYFQASKTTDPVMREKIINAPTPAKAKMLGKKCRIKTDWNNIKYNVMFDGVYAKFSQNVELLDKLLNTPDYLLVEKNSWNDKYWGVDINTGYGLNKLGEILKEVKRHLSNCFTEPTLIPAKALTSSERLDVLINEMQVKSKEIVVKMFRLEDGRLLIIEQPE